MLETIMDIVGSVLLVAGCGLVLIAAIAVNRFPDLLSRQHAATKPQVFGLILAVTGMALVVRDGALAWTALLIIAFQFVTSPISAHMIGRAGYRTGGIVREDLVVDELGDDIESTRSDLKIGPKKNSA
ncbi:monovalent cation/H(+) antiporter subunit G [Flaviflexus massiliensis]|uniref:monovalent cation/H(+) antiporter subunit G n=1 Tax=Flaviflexus massiliensis TaxID=1522309 RepID=UPI0006D58B39|nr:monovalent cation/H(+) antiporter subunit G [Flaviflexus massiliensis]